MQVLRAFKDFKELHSAILVRVGANVCLLCNSFIKVSFVTGVDDSESLAERELFGVDMLVQEIVMFWLPSPIDHLCHSLIEDELACQLQGQLNTTDMEDLPGESNLAGSALFSL